LQHPYRYLAGFISICLEDPAIANFSREHAFPVLDTFIIRPSFTTDGIDLPQGDRTLLFLSSNHQEGAPWMGELGQWLRRTVHLDLWITATSRASQFPTERAPHRYQLFGEEGSRILVLASGR